MLMCECPGGLYQIVYALSVKRKTQSVTILPGHSLFTIQDFCNVFPRLYMVANV